MDAVILAGGLGTRLRPFTEVLPKPLLPLGDRSILEHQLVSLQEAGATDVYIATNYLSHLIEAFLGDGSRLGLKIHISKETSPLGTAGPIKLLERELQSPFLVMNGDIVTKLDFKRFHDFGSREDSLLTVGTKIITTPFRFGNVTTENGYITGVEEKPDFKLEIVAGMYCMSPGIMKFIPADTYFGIDQLIKALLRAGERISRFLIEDYWLDIGQVEDYSKAREMFKQTGK
ncbi:MAG TPA: sugar phosphate nucleotidyltransferase [Bryobacteraceae bacterium]|nr:sugar phosphate nucleotidyltransferase [Bryobacteraceae bacterium]